MTDFPVNWKNYDRIYEYMGKISGVTMPYTSMQPNRFKT